MDKYRMIFKKKLHIIFIGMLPASILKNVEYVVSADTRLVIGDR